MGDYCDRCRWVGGDYTFTLDDCTTNPIQTQTADTYTFSGLGSGNYDINLEDANGCAIAAPD